MGDNFNVFDDGTYPAVSQTGFSKRPTSRERSAAQWDDEDNDDDDDNHDEEQDDNYEDHDSKIDLQRHEMTEG